MTTISDSVHNAVTKAKNLQLQLLDALANCKNDYEALIILVALERGVGNEIAEWRKTMIGDGRSEDEVNAHIDDWRNIAIESFPNGARDVCRTHKL